MGDFMGYGKRGMALENLIQYTNKIYRAKGLALVDKVPTPWTIHYDKKTRKVYKAFPKEKSTVDFIGVFQGRSIAFDAKSTEHKTRFPLNNIKEHQIQYLKKHREHCGISFFIVEFEKHQEFYFLPIEKALEWWEGMENGRKSIPYKWFKENCGLIRSENGVPLDYLKYCYLYIDDRQKGGRASDDGSKDEKKRDQENRGVFARL